MVRETVSIELELEDIELLATVSKETGKSTHQLILEAIRATYDDSTDSLRDAEALLEATRAVRRQVQKLLAAIEEQQIKINLLTKKSKVGIQPTPPRLVFIPSPSAEAYKSECYL